VEVLKVSSLAGPSGPGCKANDTLAGMAFGSRKKGVEKLYVVCLSKDEARLAKAVGLSLDPPSIFTRKLCKDFKMLRRVVSAAIAAFLGLLTIAGIGSLGALAQTDVSFKEWTVPTKGSHPHDPLAAADGTIWYTGQMTSVLGRLNPRTGVFREYRTKTPESGPHGLTADQEGNIWFTGNFAGYIGKLDPNTGAITEYRLPQEARDPHTPVFDEAGNLWFTVQGSDMIGRLVPKTGDIKLVHVPTANALPYGIVVNSNGVSVFRGVRHQQTREH